MRWSGILAPAFAFPVLVVESDDWGADEPTRAEAQARALERMLALLSRHRDAVGRPAVMAIGLVGGIIDRVAWRTSGRYQRLTLADPSQHVLVEILRAGVAAGVFAIQWHGMEHYWPDALLATACEPEVARWLGSDAPTEALPEALQSRWVDGSRLPSRALPERDIESAVAEEAALFAELFNTVPQVAVPNTFVWNDAVERAWRRAGVRFVVTCGRRYTGRDAQGRLDGAEGPLFDGMNGPAGLTYLVRDVYFEPARGHDPGRLLEGLARKVRQGRPCLAESHRINYLGTTAEAAFVALDRALAAARDAYPDLRFASTAELGRALVTRDPAWVRGPRPGHILARLREP